MRLKFVRGKQRKLINAFKTNKHFTRNRLANFLGIKEGKLKAYLDETSLIDNELYNLLDKEKKYEKFILDRKENNWGKKKGGKNSKGTLKKINIPRDSKELSEFYGIMLGDGNSHRTNFYNSRKDKRGVYMVRIVGDSRLDNNYLLNYVRPLIEKLFDIQVKEGKFRDSNAMFILCHSVQLVGFLEKKGFPPGNKIKNNLVMPKWIKANRTFLRGCLRGLYDTDGSVYKLTNQNSYQICFTNKNQLLLKDVRAALLSLGINCSRISKEKDIYITKKSELRKFLKLVGFNNDRHLKKVKMWNLDSPVV